MVEPVLYVRKELIFSIACVVLPFILGWIHSKMGKKNLIETLLNYYLFIGVGIQGLITGLYQTVFSDVVASTLKIPFSPYMLELGMANISYGILGILSVWSSRGFKTAVALGYSLFFLLTASLHLIAIEHEGVNVGNTGGYLIDDLLMPVVIFTLLLIRQTSEKDSSLKND